HYGDKFFIRTNLDAKNFKVVETSVTQTGKENWKDLIPARDNVLVEDIDIFKDYLVISERKEGLTHLRIKPWDLNVKDHYISFQDPAYTAYTSVNPEFDSQLLRYGYTSLTTPNSIYEYNMNTRENELLKQQEVVGGYNPEEYQSERVFAKADDGTEIPISIVYKK